MSKHETVTRFACHANLRMIIDIRSFNVEGKRKGRKITYK